MPELTRGAKIVTLDPEVLAGVSAGDDIQTWRKALRDGGVLRERVGPPAADVDHDELAVALFEVQRRFELLERERAAREALPLGVRLLSAVNHHAAPLIGGGLLAVLGVASLGPAGALLGLAGAAALHVTVGSPAVDRAQQLTQRPEPTALRLHEAVQRLIGRSFAEVVGEVVFVCAPHRVVLKGRAADVVSAARALEARDRELMHLRNGLVDTNEQLGRPAEDEEVAAIDAERERIRAQLQELRGLGVALKQQIERYEEALTQLRLIATRQALSQKVGAMLEAPLAEEARRAAAEIEVDLMDVEHRFAGLHVEISDADAALRAAMEVAALSRRG